ncbi:hypothetical protein glysoja_046594 [Glycine soja]|uniref:Uncharacterized protein n=1 Tax=Glycine soja TaxID=3848 RepID=A0A0B2QZH1_GLYSO|nr:hypothetical protein glysoja_046594 [Glycine soja]
MGEGVGLKDVSYQIANEGQLLGTQEQILLIYLISVLVSMLQQK